MRDQTTRTRKTYSGEGRPRYLNVRHKRILAFMADGYTDDQIAHRTHVTTNTVKTHIRRFMRYLGARNRTQAVVMAIRRDILIPTPTPPVSILHPRQKRILAYMADGLTNPEIAQKCAITVEATKTRVKHILRLLHARNRTHAVVTAIRQGILIPTPIHDGGEP